MIFLILTWNCKNNEILELDARIMEIMKILEFHTKIMKIMKILELQENHENHENLRISFENHGNQTNH